MHLQGIYTLKRHIESYMQETAQFVPNTRIAKILARFAQP